MATPTKKPGAATGKRSRLYWAVPAVLVALVLVVLAARLVVGLPAVASFVTDYPGQSALPAGAPVGFPAWLAWQHFLNAFFLLLIIRTGWQVRTTTRPSGHWTRNNKGLIRTRNAPTKISLELWFHLTLDALWILNGLVFAVLLFATGQWMRIVPTSWDVFPNALSAALQYASLDWPTEDGWINYNALQLLAYFVTVFLAAPLAFITGLRMSSAWPKKAAGLNKAYPIEWARAVHFPVMIYFVAHRGPRLPGAHHGCTAEPEPHVRGPGRRRLVRLLGVPGLRGRHGGRVVPGPPGLPAAHRLPHGQGQPLRPPGTPQPGRLSRP